MGIYSHAQSQQRCDAYASCGGALCPFESNRVQVSQLALVAVPWSWKTHLPPHQRKSQTRHSCLNATFPKSSNLVMFACCCGYEKSAHRASLWLYAKPIKTFLVISCHFAVTKGVTISLTEAGGHVERTCEGKSLSVGSDGAHSSPQDCRSS